MTLPRKRLRLFLFLMPLMLIGAGSAWAQDDDDDDDDDEGSRLDGTWFCDTFIPPGFGINQTQILLTAGPRGTIKTAETDDLAGFNPSLVGFAVQTSGAGGWKRTGGHSFALNYLQFGFSGTGPSAGLFSFLTRFRCAVTVNGEQFTGPCDADIWFGSDPDGDGIPNSPNPVTTAPNLVIPDIDEKVCTRIPVLPKQ